MVTVATSLTVAIARCLRATAAVAPVLRAVRIVAGRAGSNFRLAIAQATEVLPNLADAEVGPIVARRTGGQARQIRSGVVANTI